MPPDAPTAEQIAEDAIAAAGFRICTADLALIDPLRHRLALRFAAAARTYDGDSRRLADFIRPRLPAAVQACQRPTTPDLASGCGTSLGAHTSRQTD